MNKQLKIAFIWDFSVEPLQLYGWADGLNAALKVLAQKYGHTVKVIPSDNPNEIYEQIENFMPDIILAWGSIDRPSFAGLKQFNKPVESSTTAIRFPAGCHLADRFH